MRILAPLLLITSILLHSQLDAQTITWSKRSGPYGGSIRDILVHSSGVVYALADNPSQTIFRSADNGNNWTEHAPTVMGSDAHRIYDIALAADGSIYALANQNLFKTSDNGGTWTKVNTGSGPSNAGFEGAEEFAINSVSGTLYVMGYHYSDGKYTVFRSVNNGATWTNGYQGERFAQVTVNSIGDVYGIKSGFQMWKSNNDGSTFAVLGGTAPTDVISNAVSLTVKPNGTQLALSTSTSAIYLLDAPFTGSWNAVVETNIAEPTSYGTNSKLLYSSDNTTLYLFDNNNNKVYSHASVATGSWTAKATNFITSAGENISCAASRDVNNLYVGSYDIGVYKSINGGLGWSEINTGIEALELQSMAVADNENIITAGDICFRSSDEGQSWSKITTIASDYRYTVIKTNVGTPKTLLLLSQMGGPAYKSTNNGVDWNPITNVPSNARYYGSSDGVKLVAYDDTELYYSPDQGTTWSANLAISGMPTSYRFDAYGSNSLAMDQNGIIYTFAYDYTASTVKFFKITPNNLTNPTTASATQIPFTTMGMGNFVDEVKYLNNKIYVLGDPASGSGSVVSVTANAGVAWTPKTLTNSSFRLQVDPVNNYLFCIRSAGSSYIISLSRDDGTTFTTSTVNIPSNSTYPYGIAVNSSGIAYAGFGASSVHRTTSTIVTPIAPTGLVSVGNSTDQVTLQFNDNTTNEQYYVVEKFNGTSYDSLTRTGSFGGGKGYIVVPGLQPNTSYTFRVYAQNSAGKSSGATVTTSTLEACASTIPDNKSWSGNVNGGTTLTNVSIKHLANGTYTISDVNNGAYTGQTTIDGVFAVGCVGANSQTYYYSDYPLVINGNGTWNSGTNTLVLRWTTESGISPAVNGTVTLVKNANDPTPTAPTGVAAYVYSDNSVEVNWTASAFEKTFIIERKTGAGGTYAQVGSVDFPAMTFMDSGPFTLNTTYFYRVKSANGNTPTPGESPYSSEAQVTFKKPNLVLAQTTVNTTTLNSIGTVWADFNKDGFDDLIYTPFQIEATVVAAPTVFQNTGTGNFTSVSSNIEAASYLAGTTADYDNDGDIDIFYSSIGKPSSLYNGNGTFNFTKVDPTVVAEGSTGVSSNPPFSASWVDYDKDGLLDLFVGKDGNITSSLFKQNTDHSFTKMTTAGDLVTTVMRVFGMAWADYDNDGDQDVFIIEDQGGQPSKLFRNNGDGTFTRLTSSIFETETTAISVQSASWGDFDNDQDLDIFIGDEDGVNSLFRNNGNGTFSKLTTAAFNVTSTGALGCNWVDVNNDGFIDLVVTGQSGNELFINSNGTSFTRTAGEKFLDTSLFSIAAASSDFNNDGFMDISISRSSIDEDGPRLPASCLLFKNNNTTGNWLKIKLTGTVSNKSGIGARIKVTAGSINQIREVIAHIGTTSQNSLTQHVGLGSATQATVEVKWPSGIIQTLTNVNVNTTLEVTEDGTGPVATVLSPAHNATTVSPSTTTLSITLNETSTHVAGKMLLLYLHSDMTTPVTGVNVNNAAKSGNTYTFTLPAALSPSTQYNVSVDAGAFLDVFGNPSLEFPTGLWTFTTTSAIDGTAPSITLGAFFNSFAKGFGTQPRQVTVTDNVGVTSVVVSIRKISGTTYTEVNATKGIGADADKWGIVMSENNHFDAAGAELFITATDAAGNTARSPSGTSTHKIYLHYEDDQAAVIDPDFIGSGGTKTGWKVFSIPFELGNNKGVATIFDELTGNPDLENKVDYRFLTIQDGGSNWTEYATFSTINRGQGYFINVRNPVTIKIPNAQAPDNSRDDLFQLDLNKGWNMVGNPYLTQISWDNVATLNSLSGDAAEILKYNGTSYVTGTQTLDPWEGAFVFLDAAIADVDIPFLGQTAIGGRKGYKSLGPDVDNDEWIMHLDLQQGEHRYELGAIGMAAEAKPGYDHYDGVTPPRFIDYLEMNFAHPEYFAKRFTRDIVQTQQGYTWDFTVDSNLEGQAELTWDNARLATAAKELFLLDVSRQKLLSMNETGSYSFDPKESSNFKIYFGENLKIAPERTQLGKAWPNPSSGTTTVSFSLPEAGGTDQLVTLDVIDAMGKTAAVVTQGRFNSGYHEVSFNAKELNNGFYAYRLTVQGKQGKVSYVDKLVIK